MLHYKIITKEAGNDQPLQIVFLELNINGK